MRPRFLFVGAALSLVLAVGTVPAIAQKIDVPPAPASADLLSEIEASRLAAETGEPVVASEYTTERDLVTAVPGEGLVVESTVDPVRVKRDDKWVDADTSLKPRGDGRLVPAAAVSDISLSADGSGAVAEMTTRGGERLALSWPSEYGDLPSAQVDGDLAVFRSVWPDVDLVVRAGIESFSTYLVIYSAEAAARPEVADFAFDLEVEGAQLRTDEDGRVEAVDAAGEVVAMTDVPRAWDSGETGSADGVAGPGSSETSSATAIRDLVQQPVSARTVDMTMDIEPADGLVSRAIGDGHGDRLRLKTPRHFLANPELSYPIVLDPSVAEVTGDNSRWAMVWSSGDDWYGSPDDTRGRVGYDGWSSATKTSRMYYQFPVDQFDGVDLKIVSAKLEHKQIHSPENTCDTSGPPSVKVYRTGGYGEGISWGNQPSAMSLQDEDTARAGNMDEGCDHRIQTWDVVDGLRGAKSEDWPYYTLRVQSADESDKYGWRQYGAPMYGYPKLVVTYNRAPNEPSSRSVRNDTSTAGVWYDDRAWVRTHYPRVTATVSDPDGDKSRMHHEIRNSSGGLVESHTSNYYSSPTEVAWTIDTYLPDGTYTWKVWGEDDQGFEGPAYAAWTIVVDTVKPDPPSVTAPKLASYGTGVKLTLDSPPADGVLRYHWGFLTSATPSSKTLTSLSAPHEVTRTGHMGPDWITAKASDVAGNVSGAKVAKFKVMGASTSHQWRLDGNGTDVAPSDPAPLALTGSPTFAAGHDAAYDPVGSGSVTWAGNDRALSLNGSSQYAKSSGGAQNLVNLGEGFSVSAWVKLDAAGYGRTTVVAAFPDASDNYARARLWLRSNKWNFGVKFVKDGTPTMLDVESSTVTLEQATGRWVHLIGVYEPGDEDGVGAKLRLYVDGEEAASAPVVDPINQNENALSPLIVGAYPNGANPVSGFFDGLIDEVRVYSGPLDPTGAYLVSREVRNTSP